MSGRYGFPSLLNFFRISTNTFAVGFPIWILEYKDNCVGILIRIALNL